jgi:hypothetical protein
MKNVVEPLKKFHKTRAVELRKKGFSYSEIRERINVPRSTLSLWLRNVALSGEQQKKLQDRRSKTAKLNSEKRILRTSKLIKELKESSAKDIKDISRREFWLMGIILYWRERLSSGNETDLKNGVRLISSDPDIINFFIRWLKEVGGIKKEELKFDIFMKKDNTLSPETVKSAVLYWSQETGFPKEEFLQHIYFQKVSSNKNHDSNKNIHSKNKNANKSAGDGSTDSHDPEVTASGNRSRDAHIYSKEGKEGEEGGDMIGSTVKGKRVQHGLLRVRVSASSMLARQIAGWVERIQKII